MNNILNSEFQCSQAKKIAQLKPKSFYNRHIYFIDFQDCGLAKNPTYINVVRDPIKIFISGYGYIRQKSKLVRYKLTLVMELFQGLLKFMLSFLVNSVKKFLHRRAQNYYYIPVKNGTLRYDGNPDEDQFAAWRNKTMDICIENEFDKECNFKPGNVQMWFSMQIVSISGTIPTIF